MRISSHVRSISNCRVDPNFDISGFTVCYSSLGLWQGWRRAVKVSLKFPNVRLFLFDLLTHGGLSGPEAIATTAREYGIIPADSFNEILAQTAGVSGCKCVATLKNILHRHFAARPDSPAVDVNDIWKAIEADALKHRKLAEIHDSNQCAENQNSSNSCRVSAPTLFDLLLQHIRRYP